MSDHQRDVLKHALLYAGLGWKVFPIHSIEDGKCTCGVLVCPDAGKHPRTGRGLKEASSDTAKIETWFGTGAPLSNVGVLTGEASGITVIDIDTADGKFGAESWAEIVKEFGEPDTLMAETGSGGMHLVFKYNSALKTATNILGKGIDSRNDGGYIVAAPSKHKSGGNYKWLNMQEPPVINHLPKHLSKRKETRGRPKGDDMYRSKYTIEQIGEMLKFIPADDRDLWRNIGIILGREFKRIDEAWQVYITWSDRWGGAKGRNHDEIMHEAFYKLSTETGGKQLGIGTLVKAAIDHGWVPKTGEVPLGNFVYFGPGNNYIYRPVGSFWVASAVDAAVSPINEAGKIVKASEWLKINQLCTSMTSHPGLEEDVIKGFDCRHGEIIAVPGACVFNTYRRPTIELGDPRMAKPWVDHVHKVFNKAGDAEQFLNYMAHRVQKPEEKPRFALLIAGDQGVGKDTAVEFCIPAIGSWNTANIEPSALEGQFNEHAATTLVRINEAANLAEMTKWAFNEKTKVLIAGTPDEVMINPKYGQKYSVKMFCGVIITTNHLASGIYIPEGDRRYDVIASATAREMGLDGEEEKKKYFTELWDWFLNGGSHHVAAWLNEHKIDRFSAGNGQRKTEAHKTVVVSGKQTDHWLVDALDRIELATNQLEFVRSDWVVQMVAEKGDFSVKEIVPKLQAAMNRHGYVIHKNSSTADGRFRFGDKKTMIYRLVESGDINMGLLERDLF
jgi:hypothetical protein